MKLAYLTLQATQEGQAAHAHVHEIVQGLQRRGVDVTLFEPDYGGNSHPKPLRRLLQFARIQLRVLLRLRQFDAIYVRSHFAALPLVVMAKLAGVATVQEINGPWDELPVSYPQMSRLMAFVRFGMRVQFRFAKALIGVTPQLATWAAGETGNKVPSFVIPNGANTELFEPGAGGTVTVASPYAIFFGALSAWQGVPTMLEAVNHRDWPEDVKLVIVGDGSEAGRVRAAVGNRVVYLGKIPYGNMPAIIAGAMVSLSAQNNLHSRSDTGLSPLKVYESMACGVPVIVSDFPGMADIVRETNTGLVIPCQDAGALARAVATLHHSPQLRQEMGARARQVAVENHSWDKRAADTLRVLEAVLAKGSSKSTLGTVPATDRPVTP